MNIRRIILRWQAWRERRKMARAYPDLARMAAERDQAKRQHKASKRQDTRLRAAMAELLKG